MRASVCVCVCVVGVFVCIPTMLSVCSTISSEFISLSPSPLFLFSLFLISLSRSLFSLSCSLSLFFLSLSLFSLPLLSLFRSFLSQIFPSLSLNLQCLSVHTCLAQLSMVCSVYFVCAY
jgi:hypothetical protein